MFNVNIVDMEAKIRWYDCANLFMNESDVSMLQDWKTKYINTVSILCTRICAKFRLRAVNCKGEQQGGRQQLL